MIHINNFIDKIKFFESQGKRDFTFSLREAKDLHGDITKLLLVLQEVRDNPAAAKSNNEVVNVELKGNDW